MLDDLSLPAPSPEQAPALDLSVVKLLTASWNLIKPRYGWFVLSLLAYCLSQLVARPLPILGSVLVIATQALVWSGLLFFSVKAYADGAPPAPGAILTPFTKRPLKIIGYSLWSSLLIILGFLLLLLPGIYLSIAYVLGMALATLTDLPLTECTRRSRQIVNRQFGDWFALLLALCLFNLAGALFFGIGLLFTVPLSIGAYALVVAQLFGIKPGARGLVGPQPVPGALVNTPASPARGVKPAATADHGAMLVLCPYCCSKLDDPTMSACAPCGEALNDPPLRLSLEAYSDSPRKPCEGCGFSLLAEASKCPACRTWQRSVPPAA